MHNALHKNLQDTVAQWAKLGAPALLERFILRNGREFAGAKKPKRYKQGTPKQCFENSTLLVADQHDLRYVEGFAMSRDFHFAFLHGWAIDADDNVIDVTLRNPEDFDYMGIVLTRRELWAELRKLEVYGLLDQGMGLNADYMFEVDPDLKAEVEAVMADGPMRKFRTTAA